MKTTQYTLKSRQPVIVEVPEEYAREAGLTVDFLVGEDTSLAGAEAVYKHLRNTGILARTEELNKALPESPEYLLLQDIIYLRICIACNEPRMRSPERGEAVELDRQLIDLVKKLEAEK